MTDAPDETPQADEEAEVPNLTGDTYATEFTESIKTKRMELAFFINVENVENLGQALDKAAINLMRWGLDSFYIVATDLDTEMEFLVANGDVTLANPERLTEIRDALLGQKDQDDDEPAAT